MTLEAIPEGPLTPTHAKRTEVFVPLVIVTDSCKEKCKRLAGAVGEVSVNAFKNPDTQYAVICPGRGKMNTCRVDCKEISEEPSWARGSGAMLRNPWVITRGTTETTVEKMIRRAVENGVTIEPLAEPVTNIIYYPDEENKELR